MSYYLCFFAIFLKNQIKNGESSPKNLVDMKKKRIFASSNLLPIR